MQIFSDASRVTFFDSAIDKFDLQRSNLSVFATGKFRTAYFPNSKQQKLFIG
jgi:hypothetical protein